MRFLADESCDYRLVLALRDAGHDVFAVAEFESQTDDSELLARARTDRRMLIGEDKDFGKLVYLQKQATAGVISIRAHRQGSDAIREEVLKTVAQHGESLVGAFVTVREGHVRIVRQPPS